MIVRATLTGLKNGNTKFIYKFCGHSNILIRD